MIEADVPARSVLATECYHDYLATQFDKGYAFSRT